MAYENPLITLGVPKLALVQYHQNLGEILVLAETIYRTLSRRFHPDLPGGDTDLMATFSEAIAELRDPDALQVYVNELVDTADVEALYRQKQQQVALRRENEAVVRLAGGLAFLDQFAAFGITEPTSYLVGFGSQRLVLDVQSPSTARVRVTSYIDVPTATTPMDLEYRDGVWHEAYSDEHYGKHWVTYNRFVSDESVKLVGLVTVDESREFGVPDPGHAALDISLTEVILDWMSPQDCWFLSELHYGPPLYKPRCVLYKQGVFAVTGPIEGFASLV